MSGPSTFDPRDVWAILEAIRLGPVRAGPFRVVILAFDRHAFVLHGVYRAGVAAVVSVFSGMKAFQRRPLVIDEVVAEATDPYAKFVSDLRTKGAGLAECDVLVLIQRQQMKAPVRK